MMPVPPPSRVQLSAAQVQLSPRGIASAQLTAQQCQGGGGLPQAVLGAGTERSPGCDIDVDHHRSSCSGAVLPACSRSSLLPLAASWPVELPPVDSCDRPGAECSDEEPAGGTMYGHVRARSPLTETLGSWCLGVNSARCSHHNPVHKPGIGGRMVSDRRGKPSRHQVLRTRDDSSTTRLIDRGAPSYGLQTIRSSELPLKKHVRSSDAAHLQHDVEANERVKWWPLGAACLFVAFVVACLLLVLLFPPAATTGPAAIGDGLHTRTGNPGRNR